MYIILDNEHLRVSKSLQKAIKITNILDVFLNNIDTLCSESFSHYFTDQLIWLFPALEKNLLAGPAAKNVHCSSQNSS